MVAIDERAAEGQEFQGAYFDGSVELFRELTVTNNGPSTAVAPTVSDTIPANLGSPSTSTAGCGITAGTLTCTLADMASLDLIVQAFACDITRLGAVQWGNSHTWQFDTPTGLRGELHMGTHSMFATAGFEVVSRPSPRRAVMRIDFDGRLPVASSGNQRREQ